MALTTVDQGLLGSNAQYTGFKNRIINGAMVIDQRNAGASVTVSPSNNLYRTVDRWYTYAYPSSTTGVFTIQQRSDTPPADFSNYLRATVTTAKASMLTTDYYSIEQRFEGYNVADLGMGTANARSFTISFWVRSSTTGTYSVTAYGTSQGMPKTYTINSANTWEYKTITWPAITDAAFASSSLTNGQGLVIVFALGMGPSYSGAANVLASNAWAVTGQTNLMATVNNTLDITGVQLEKGSTATSFDYRPYGTELALCQRYYWNAGIIESWAFPLNLTNTYRRATINYPVTMRTTPTITVTASTSGTFATGSLPAAESTTATGTTINCDVSSNSAYYSWVTSFKASAEL